MDPKTVSSATPSFNCIFCVMISPRRRVSEPKALRWLSAVGPWAAERRKMGTQSESKVVPLRFINSCHGFLYIVLEWLRWTCLVGVSFFTKVWWERRTHLLENSPSTQFMTKSGFLLKYIPACILAMYLKYSKTKMFELVTIPVDMQNWRAALLIN